MRNPGPPDCRHGCMEIPNQVNQQNLFGFADMPEWEYAAKEDVVVAEVVFNLPLEKPYTYAVPEELRSMLRPGQRVKAPLGR